MASIDELIAQALQEMNEPNGEDERVFCTIDPLTRKIDIPQDVGIFAVTNDANTNRIWFKCPRYVGDRFDLTQCTIRVNYITPAGEKDTFYTQFFEKIGDDVAFSWLIPRRAVKHRGTLSFVVCAILADADGVITEEWNTAITTATVLEGIEPDGEEPEDERVTNAVAQAQALAAMAEASAVRIETAANQALASELKAGNSEKNARTSETNAAANESKAATSETNAAKSEANAKASETNAVESERNAKASEANAAESEKNAKASETSAADSAKKASVSETNAAASERNAKASETNAAASERNAKASETNAALSENNAAQALADLLRMLGTDVATLIDGKIPSSQIPAIATTEIYTVSSNAERDALANVQDSDICVVTPADATLAKSYIYRTNGWVYLASPTDYAAQAGHAETAKTAEDAGMINGHRLVQISAQDFATAVLDEETYYLVWSD